VGDVAAGEGEGEAEGEAEERETELASTLRPDLTCTGLDRTIRPSTHQADCPALPYLSLLCAAMCRVAPTTEHLPTASGN
jgi:hypothetical protein